MWLSTKKLFSSKVVINGAWLYVLQIFNTVIPLLTLPYITRVLGSTAYGNFSITLNIIGYAQVIVNYGFDLSGASKISKYDKIQDRSELFSNILTCKVILSILTFMVIYIGSMVNLTPINDNITLLILYIVVIGTSLQQTWVFHGLQVMKFITIVNIVSRTISVVLIFLLVKNSNQLYLYSALYGLTFLINGIISMIIVKYQFKFNYYMPSIKSIWNELIDGWHIFISSIMGKLFSSFGITVLGFVSLDSVVGIYSAIQKIPLLVLMGYSPIGQALFPYYSKKFSVSFKSGVVEVIKLTKIIILIMIPISFGLILGSKWLVDLLYGSEYSKDYILMIPLVFWLFFSVLNNLFGTQILVASGNVKEYSSAFKYGVLISVILNITLGLKMEALGVAIATALSEGSLMVIMMINIKKKYEIDR